MNAKQPLMIALAMAIGLVACGESQQPTASSASAQPPAAGAPAAAPGSEALPASVGDAQVVAAAGRGRVTEALHAGGYSYLLVEAGDRQAWLATTRANVSPGAAIRWDNPAIMRNFNSKALNRTFETILFANAVLADGGGAAQAAATQQGEVIAVDTAAGYSYVQVRTAEGEKWLAAPMTRVAAGDRVSWQGGSTMRNFSSKSLNRTFDEILFVAGVTVSR